MKTDILLLKQVMTVCYARRTVAPTFGEFISTKMFSQSLWGDDIASRCLSTNWIFRTTRAEDFVSRGLGGHIFRGYALIILSPFFRQLHLVL